MVAVSALPTRVDPVTFEILRHRLWSINEEAGHTLERVSGSLIASEVHDMNTSIMNARKSSGISNGCIGSHGRLLLPSRNVVFLISSANAPV